MALSSYFDFAENDFQYFKASYDAGIVANMMERQRVTVLSAERRFAK